MSFHMKYDHQAFEMFICSSLNHHCFELHYVLKLQSVDHKT